GRAGGVFVCYSNCQFEYITENQVCKLLLLINSFWLEIRVAITIVTTLSIDSYVMNDINHGPKKIFAPTYNKTGNSDYIIALFWELLPEFQTPYVYQRAMLPVCCIF